MICPMEFIAEFKASSLKFFAYYKQLAEGAMAQLSDEQLHITLAPDSNSVAVIVQHMTGNMHSRWDNFLSNDGESATRDRDLEFIDVFEPRDGLMQRWERGWAALFAALHGLSDEDWTRSVTIRGETLSVIEAVQRQLAHYPHHVGQIVILARAMRGTDWQTLSVARGQSAAYTAAVSEAALKMRP